MVSGSWNDWQLVDFMSYKIGYFDLDIEYEISVFLIRLGEGGIGFFGLVFRIRIKCVDFM